MTSSPSEASSDALAHQWAYTFDPQTIDELRLNPGGFPWIGVWFCARCYSCERVLVEAPVAGDEPTILEAPNATPSTCHRFPDMGQRKRLEASLASGRTKLVPSLDDR
jgi:hypothetical protein